MIETPEVTSSEEQQAAVIRLTIPRSQIQEVMGPGIQEVIGTVMSQGAGPAGPVFSRHFRMDPEVFDFEVGVPVSRPVRPTGRVQPGSLPAAEKVARAVYKGDYERLGEAWGEFDAWIDAQGLQPTGELWECYVSGPESSPDPAAWRTELYRPLRSDGA